MSQDTKPETYNVFEKGAMLIIGFVTVLSFSISIPLTVEAFWSFYKNAGAAAPTFVPNSATPTLHASINIDPNPDKGLGDTIQTSGGKALIASGGPSGTIADVAKSVQSDQISVYVVRPGDTLSEIANMFNVSVNTIIWANDLSGPKDVHPGDTLIILPVSGVERVVVKGDTLKSLAKKYHADAEEIAQFNGLNASEPLQVGSTIIIPGGEVSAPAPASRPQPATTYPSGGGAFLAGYFSNPLPGGRITQGIHGKNSVDIGAVRGTPIYAPAEGTVIIVRGGGGWNGGYGNYLVISHPNGTQTLYSHLSSLSASVGQQVSSGQLIGYVGTTGRTTGPHLHFEVRGAANPFRSCAIGSFCSPQ